jgi:CheY-like chemotaxis protein
MNDHLRVLVVEDNPANQLLAASVLEREGFVVDLADSPSEAMGQIALNQPDLILMDVQLPGVDGLSFTRSLKAAPATAPIPIVAFTAHAMIGDRESAMDAGCIGYIAKPIDTRTFGGLVRGFLNPVPEADRVESAL